MPIISSVVIHFHGFLQETGLSNIISDSLRHLGSMPTPAVSLIVCVIIAMLTEVTTNSATTALLLPIVADLVRRNNSFSYKTLKPSMKKCIK